MGAVPTHEQLATNFDVPFQGNTFIHLDNSIDGKLSGHAVLRNTLVKLIESKEPKVEDFYFNFGRLQPQLLDELKNMVAELQINLTWSWSMDENERSRYFNDNIKAPINEESAQKWAIEKRYLWHWFKQPINMDPNLCVLMGGPNAKTFSTDGVRLAQLWAQNHGGVLKSTIKK